MHNGWVDAKLLALRAAEKAEQAALATAHSALAGCEAVVKAGGGVVQALDPRIVALEGANGLISAAGRLLCCTMTHTA